jgi:pyruvate-formate lyase-activating enzyme
VSKQREGHYEDQAVRSFMVDSVEGQHQAFRQWGLPVTRVMILYNACAFRCFFCASAGTTFRDPEDRTGWGAIQQHLGPAKPEEEGRLILAGNEPLLHPDFERTIALASRQGFDNIQLMTSGNLLGDEAALKRWVAAGLRSVAVPIYSATPALHDEIVGEAAHQALFQALDMAHSLGVNVHVHTLALRRTAGEISALAELTQRRWRTHLSIAPIRDKEGQFDWASEALSLVEFNQMLDELPSAVPICLVGFPTCVGRGRPRAAADTVSVYFMTQARRYAAICDGCEDRPACPGLVEAYYRHTGHEGLSPTVIS